MNYLGILACIAPIYLIIYTYRHDRTEREPFGLILKLFLFGCISVIPILIVETALTYVGNILHLGGIFYNLFDAFIIAGTTEESFKFLFLNLGSFKHKAFDTSYDGIIYSVTVSMGFAIVENIGYCLMNGDLSTVIARSLLSIPGHCAFGVLMGIFYARAKMYYSHGNEQAYHSNKKKSLLYAILFHGLYDFCLMEGGIFIYVFIVVMIFVYIQLFKTIKVMSISDHKIVDDSNNTSI